MKKLIAIFWGALTTLILLVALSCDTTKPKPPVLIYELNLISDATESNVYADFNITTVNLIAELKDEDGNFLEGKTISFTWENTDHAITLGTITPTTLTTNTNGKVSVIFEDNGQEGAVEVTAKYVDEYNNTITQSISFTILPNEDQVSTLTLTSSAAENRIIVADNAPEIEYLTTFNAFVRDDLGNVVQNVNVHFSNLTMLGSLLNTQAMSNNIGKASVSLSSLGSELGDATIKAFITLNDLARAVSESSIPLTFLEYDFQHLERSESEISDTLTVQYILQSQYIITTQVASISLNAVPESVLMDDFQPDSVYTVALNATVRDENGVAVSGVPVHFENLTPDKGTITGTNISTNTSGIASTTLSANIDDAGDVHLKATILDPNNPGTPAFYANKTVYLRTLSESIIAQAAHLSTWISRGILPNGSGNTSNVDTLYARVTNFSGGAVQGIPVHFERVSGSIGVLSATNMQTNASGIAKTIFTTLTSEITQDSMTVSIQISIPGSNLDPQVRVFTFNFEGSEILEYNVNRFEWYKGFSVSSGLVEPIFIGDQDSISVSSDFDYLLMVASVIDYDGVRINRIPIRFSINNGGANPNGDLSSSIEHTCCAQDTLGANAFITSSDMTLLNYVIDPGHPDEASGLVPILYYIQSVNVCDNIVSKIVDPLDNSVVLYTNPLKVCTVEDAVPNPIDLVQNLTFTTNPNNVTLIQTAPDSTYRVVLTATVLNGGGVPVAGVPVQFINHTPLEGILMHGNAISNAFGYARDTLFVTHEDVGPIQLEAIVNTSPVPLTRNRTVAIYDYVPPILIIDHIEAWPKNAIISISDPNSVYTDTLYAKALTVGGAIIQNAPLYFSLTNPSVGSISANQVFTNSQGIASVVYYTSVGIQPGSVEFVVSAPATPEVAPVHKFIAIVGQSLPDSTVSTLTLNATPSQIVVMENTPDSSYSITFRAIAKDVYGVAVQNVPVYFQNLTPPIGTLSLSLAFTDSVGVARSTLNLENDTFGTANIKSYILSSVNDNDTLFTSYRQVTVMTENEWRIQNVTSLLAWPSAADILVTRMDSTYCDTLYAVAQNASGGGIKDINVNFSATPTYIGYLTHSDALTDTSGSAKTTFCVVPGTLDTNVDINVSIPGSTVTSSTFSIGILDRLPTCPDCTPDLSLWADDYVLPSNTGSLTTTVYATYSDTLGNGPIDNTIIQFQSIKDSAGTMIPVGSINPWGQFQNDTARVTFNMTNDEGVAYIIGSYAGLQDTINIVLNAGALVYTQFIASYPSEITVQGGGGLEATEITVQLRDGSNNLVSEDYRIYFEITAPTPSGVHFNGQSGLRDIDVISSNGSASVTVNSGTHPGSVRIRASAYESDDVYHQNPPITSAIGIPVSVVTGPPAYGIIAMSYVDLINPGGGIYQLPLSVSLWDVHSNPVRDSTTVWLALYEASAPYDPLTNYLAGDLAMWAADGGTPIDSLVYICLQDTVGIPPTGDPISSFHWALNSQPGFIEGEAKTGELNMNGDAFRGIAWASTYYTSLDVFKSIIIKAQTYNGNGDWFIVDSRDGNNGQPFPEPVCPGSVNIGSSVVFWDFSTFPNVNNPPDMIGGGCYTDIIQISATLTDCYLEFISNGRLQLSTIGGQLLTVPPASDPTWNPDPVQVTDPNGQARWYIRYNIALCPVTDPQTCSSPDCEACEYDDFPSDVWVNLLDPQQMTSNQIEISLQRSGGECANCP